MFQQPKKSASTYNVIPPPNLDLDERYLFKLVNLTDEGLSRYADPAKGESFHNVGFHFRVARTSTMQPLFDADGNPWEYVEFGTSKTGKNPKNGMVAKSRLFIEALLGHTVEDDEITADLPQQLIGRYATGFFEYADRETEDGTKYKKLVILKLSPYKEGAPSEPKPAPPPPPEPVSATSGSLPF